MFDFRDPLQVPKNHHYDRNHSNYHNRRDRYQERAQARDRSHASSPDGPGEYLGGADRDRTGDPLLAKQVLSQLSYSPTRKFQLSVISFQWFY